MDLYYTLDYNSSKFRACCTCECRPCECRCTRHCNRCRGDLCDDDFSIRLAGLTEGFNFRLHELLWCEVAIMLDNKDLVVGTIVFVGSNFVEMLIPLENGEPVEEEIHTDLDEGLTLEEEDELDEYEEREDAKGRTLIFPIAKIVSVELNNL